MEQNLSIAPPSTFAPIPLGQYLKPVGIERLKLNAGQTAICSVITLQAWPAYTHYDSELKLLFHCFHGKCCTAKEAQERYVVPLLCYTGTDKAKYGGPYSLKYYSMGKSTYTRLVNKAKLCRDLYGREINTCDIEITCENGEFQNFNFEVIGVAKYMQTEPNYGQDIVNQFMADWNACIYTSIAAPITPERYDELKRMSMSRMNAAQVPPAQQYGGFAGQQPRGYGQQGGYHTPPYPQRGYQQPPMGYNRPQPQAPAPAPQVQQAYAPAPAQIPAPMPQAQPSLPPQTQYPQGGHPMDSSDLNGVDIDGLVAQSSQQVGSAPAIVPNPPSAPTHSQLPVEDDSDPFDPSDSSEEFKSMI